MQSLKKLCNKSTLVSSVVSLADNVNVSLQRVVIDCQQQIIAVFVSLVFLGQAFTIMLVYVWSRRNPYVRMNFFGLFTFQAPYLPWVLLGFSLLLGNSVIVDLMGQ